MRATAMLTDTVQLVSKSCAQVVLNLPTESFNFRNTFVYAWKVFLRKLEENARDAEVAVQFATVKLTARAV